MTNAEKKRAALLLMKTVFMYNEWMRTHYKPECPLCIAYRAYGNPSNSICRNCIHLSEFGQGKVCVEQKSYINIFETKKSTNLNISAIKYRQAYLKSMIQRLLKSIKNDKRGNG